MSYKTPSNLYKYLSFNENTMECLISHTAYYSDPSQFNDPLDCKPVVVVDVSLDVLEKVACQLIRMKSEKELSSMTKRFKFNDSESERKISSLSESDVLSFLKDVNYYSNENEDLEPYNYKKYRYQQAIQEEIVSVFRKGVWCLSSKYDSPLMWSHYANNHKGICIEYDMSDVDDGVAKKIIYGGSRNLKVSLIEQWLDTGKMPNEIEDVCMLTKSRDWRYESEWRLFGKIGVEGIEPSMKSVIFGMNCKETTIALIINAFLGFRREIKFWKISNIGDGFKLKRHRVDEEEYMQHYSNILTYGEIKKIFGDSDPFP